MEITRGKANGKRIGLILAVILCLSLVVFIAVFYISKLNFYKEHFMTGTFINGIDCSELDITAVASILEEDAKNYSITIAGRDEDGNPVEVGVITAEEMELMLQDGVAAAKGLLAQQNPVKWIPYAMGKEQQSFQAMHVTAYNEEKLEKSVLNLEAFQKSNMIAPADAYISEYKEELSGCEIVPEVKGTQLKVEAALSCIKAMVNGGADEVDLVVQNCYKEPQITATDVNLISKCDMMNKWLGTRITYDWNANEVIVDGSLIEQWILTDEDGTIAIDQGAVEAFVAENASKYDTYGKSRQFITTLGVELTLGTGGFGWKTDRKAVANDLVEYIEAGAVTKAEPIYSNTAPWKGMNDIGNSYVEADLSNQHLYLYYKGELVFETDFVSGTMNATPDCVSPAGVFDITYKTTNATLRGGDYEQFVYYWMPFFGNYGMHDATWRWQFGGNIFMTDGSHGCLNLPLDAAATIYSYIYEGYPVICYYY